MKKKQATFALLMSCIDKTLEDSEIKLPNEVKKIYADIRALINLKLNRYKRCTNKEIAYIYLNIKSWSLKSGWDEQVKHPATSSSFACLLCEKIGEKELSAMFSRIYLYYEAKKQAPAPSLWSSELAFERWQECWK